MDVEVNEEGPTIDDVISRVEVFVSADVRITRYTKQYSGNTAEPTVTIVTSLDASIRDESSKAESSLDKVSKTQLSQQIEDTFHSEDIYQPILRRSRKSTKINDANSFEPIINPNRIEIERMVLLPYFGCTEKPKYQGKHIFVKSSKSFEQITNHRIKIEQSKILRSRSLTRNPWKKVNINRESVINRNNIPFNKYSPDNIKNSFQSLLRQTNYVNHPSSPLNDMKIYKNKLDERNMERSDACDVYSEKIGLIKNVKELNCEMCGRSFYSQPKTTRNVSILQRPRTRNQATSTTSLNNTNLNNKPIGGLLNVAADKAFPSELILSLVSKKEVIGKKNKQNNEFSQNDSQDILKPIVHVAPKHNRKKKTSLLRRCFSKSNDNYSRSSEENMSKEIYYPSVVEVQSKKRKKFP